MLPVFRTVTLSPFPLLPPDPPTITCQFFIKPTWLKGIVASSRGLSVPRTPLPPFPPPPPMLCAKIPAESAPRVTMSPLLVTSTTPPLLAPPPFPPTATAKLQLFLSPVALQTMGSPHDLSSISERVLAL